MTSPRLLNLLAEYERVSAAMLANFERPTGGRGKQGLRRTDAAIRRGAKYCEQLRQLERQIHALGGEIPRDEPAPKLVRAPKPERPELVGPQLPDPRTMTRNELKAEDVELDGIRRAAKVWTLTPRHRAIKSALGEFAAADARARVAAHRSEGAKRGAATRAARKAAGLPPKHLEWLSPPPGGWTDADRV